MAKKNELAVQMDEETLALLQESYPVEEGMKRIILPRLGMVSQDKVEGKGKDMKVVAEAGTFFTEVQTDEVDSEGKKTWNREELGTSVEGVILYARKQLKMYDEATESYTSSPVYDADDQVLPLWANKAKVAEGTPSELKAKYEYTDKDGKTKSKLEENRILYILKDGVVYQMNLRGSSMYSFLTYSRSTLPPAYITLMSSESKEKGSIAWNQMTFIPKRKITASEASEIVPKVQEIKAAVQMERAQFAKPTNNVNVIAGNGGLDAFDSK